MRQKHICLSAYENDHEVIRIGNLAIIIKWSSIPFNAF